MDHIRILKRAFHITWNYKVLWIFGILLALTTPNGGGNGGNNGVQFSGSSGSGSYNWPQFSPQVGAGIVGAVIALICFAFLLAIAFTVVRYVSEAASIRMVDRYETTGEKVNFRQGWRLGWSRSALTLFLVDLLVGFVGVAAFFLLLILAASPLLLWLTQNDTLSVIGTAAAVGLFVLLIFLFILIAIAASLVMQFVKRAVVLEGKGVFDGIKRGINVLRRRLGDAIIMGLLMFAIGLGATLLILPLILLLLAIGLLLGGGPGLLVGLLVSQFTEGALPVILGFLIGLPIFFIVVVIPGLFIGGLYQTYKWTTWTLTYREMVALEGSAPVTVVEAGPEPEAPVPDEGQEAPPES